MNELIALNEMSQATTTHDALNIYKKNFSHLNDWMFLFADDRENGPLTLKRQHVGKSGILSSIFSGKSLYIIDKKAASSSEQVQYKIGTGIYFDSNTASYIRSLAYKKECPPRVLKYTDSIHQTKIDYGNINPYLYLWESQRHYHLNDTIIQRNIETVAALSALKSIDGPLNLEWGELYRKYYKEQCEFDANMLIESFFQQLNSGLRDAIKRQNNMIEAILLRAKLIDVSSKISSENKFELLIQFMHDELSTIMYRELLICSEILFRNPHFSLYKKLNSLENKKDPLALINNCAWDMYLFRVLDQLSCAEITDQQCDFYIANMLTYDRDLTDIFAYNEVQCLGINKKRAEVKPFFKKNALDFIKDKIGEKKASKMESIFNIEETFRRNERREKTDIEGLIMQDREQLLKALDRND